MLSKFFAMFILCIILFPTLIILQLAIPDYIHIIFVFSNLTIISMLNIIIKTE